MKRFLKDWGGWVAWGITIIFSTAIFVFTQREMAKDIKDIKLDQKTYNEFMIEQAGLNGEFIMYIKLKNGDGL